jgi:hypothetical protein
LFLLAIVQIQTTSATRLGYLTEIENVEKINRMAQYPPYGYRLANIIEARPESIIYFQLEKNFIKIFDLRTYFDGIIKIFFLPLFLFGLFQLLKLNLKITLIFCLIPIILLTLIGHSSLHGPLILLPLIYSAAAFGLFNIYRLTRDRHA